MKTDRRATIRKALLAARKEQPQDLRARAGDALQARAAALPVLREARAVALYLAMPHEAPTARLAAELHASGRALFAPVADGRGGYRFARYAPDAPTRRGALGIREPERTGDGPDVIDLVLVPGVAFDPAGGRLGHGAGHYDRMLAPLRERGTCFVALAFELQIVEDIPMLPHDVRMHWIVTEARTIACDTVAAEDPQA